MNPTQLRSETLRRFSEWNLEPNPSLPLLESMHDLRPKSPKEVAARAVAAGYIAALCYGAPAEKVRSDLKRFHLCRHLSEDEQRFVAMPKLDDLSKVRHSWLVESIQLMGWALGLLPINHFEPCSGKLAGIFPRAGSDPSDFINSAEIRSLDELRQEADILYMLHWFGVDAELSKQTEQKDFLPRVRYRRHAADWTIGVANAWDDVPLDT